MKMKQEHQLSLKSANAQSSHSALTVLGGCERQWYLHQKMDQTTVKTYTKDLDQAIDELRTIVRAREIKPFINSYSSLAVLGQAGRPRQHQLIKQSTTLARIDCGMADSVYGARQVLLEFDEVLWFNLVKVVRTTQQNFEKYSNHFFKKYFDFRFSNI